MDSKTMALIRDSIRGVAEVYDTPLGLAISRLPAWAKSHHEHDALTGIVAGQASGVRILIETSATEITLIYRATLDKSIMNGFSSHSTASLTCDGFEASVSHSNGNSRIWNGPSNPKFEEGEDSVAVFKLPPSDNSRLVSICLPHNCEIQIVDLAANAPMTPGTPPAVRWLHYGSSISHSGEAENPLGVWPTRVAIDEGFDLYSLGLAGSCNLEYFAARTIAAWPADLITLKLGINVVNGATMTERTFIPAVHGLLDTIRMVQPKVRIVVISPIYCEGHETNPGPTTPGIDGKATGAEPNANEWVKELTLVRAREILADIATKRADSNLEYLDGLKLFSASDAHLMPDGLHPNAEGYLLMAERFKTEVFG